MHRGHGQQKLDRWQWKQFKEARIGNLYELKPHKEGEPGYYHAFGGSPKRYLSSLNSMKKHDVVEMPPGIYMLTEAYLVDEQLSLIDNTSETVRAYVLKFLTPEEKVIEAKFPNMKALFKFLDDNFNRLR